MTYWYTVQCIDQCLVHLLIYALHASAPSYRLVRGPVMAYCARASWWGWMDQVMY